MPDRARRRTRARTRAFGILIGIAAVWMCAGVPPARAIPPAAPPLGRPSPSTPSPEPTPAGPILPYGSPLFFVLDDKIDSGKTPIGTVIRLHLERPLIVGGVELAPGGAPATLTIVSRKRANVGDEDGAVQVHLDALQLPGRPTQPLSLRLLHEYLTIEHSAGQLATRDTTDTIGDIFIPYHVLYHYLRPGHQYVLPPGTLLRAVTQVTIDATNPHTIVFETPPPFESTYDEPHSELTPMPLYTPAPQRPHPLPKGKPTLPPTPAPTITPTPAPSDTPAANASALPVASAAAFPAPSTSGRGDGTSEVTQGRAALDFKPPDMKIFRTALAAATLLIALVPAVVNAADPSPEPAATLAPVPTASEQPFVDKASKDLEAMYPTAADAEKAGYLRYTYEDKTGSISYANRKWTSTDADHPSQLWYDAGGKLIGADYSVLWTATPPVLFGMDPARWEKFGAHVHYGIAAPDGMLRLGATGGPKFTKAGGSIANPTAAQLVAAGIAKKASDVKFVFAFPKIWDLEVWLIPNPNGAFAEMNPNVKPVHPVDDDM